MKKNWIQRLKPGIPQRYLLLLGALAWTCAGSILLYKGVMLLPGFTAFPLAEFILGLAAGFLFYVFLFSRISLRHTRRILTLKIEYPCMFSFFNVRSYVLMGTMITSGILLRKSGVVPPDILLLVYLMMGIPLFLSSFRFYKSFITWKGRLSDE